MENYPLYDYSGMAVSPPTQPSRPSPAPNLFPLYPPEGNPINRTNTFTASPNQKPPPYQVNYVQPNQPPYASVPPAYRSSGSNPYNVPPAWPQGSYNMQNRGWGAGYPGSYNQAPPQMQQQQQTTTVVIGGQARPAIYQPVPFVQSYNSHIVLSCFTLWCCNPLLGLIAFILAAVASGDAYSDPPSARRLGKASIVLSIIGIVSTIIIIIAITVVIITWRPSNAGSSSSTSEVEPSYGSSPYTCYTSSGVATSCNNCYYSNSCTYCYSYSGYAVSCDGRR